MFSEKTTTLLNIINKFKYAKKKVLIINHEIDNRYDNGNVIVSHNQIKHESLKLHDLDTVTDIKEYDAIFIDEGQFFINLVKFVKFCLSNNKKIYVAGLNGDLNQKKIGEMHDIIAFAGKIILLSSICNNCGEEAHYSKLKIKKKPDSCIPDSSAADTSAADTSAADKKTNIIVGDEKIWEASCYSCLNIIN